jgi:hypothetical protein
MKTVVSSAFLRSAWRRDGDEFPLEMNRSESASGIGIGIEMRRIGTDFDPAPRDGVGFNRQLRECGEELRSG